MDIDTVKSQETKSTKKRDFQGIHDRFIRDPEFRSQMIENHRDEELCRRWDALAADYHTHHFTTQEYFPLSERMVASSKKQGSNAVRLTERLDFKQALSTLQQLKHKAEGDPQVPTYCNTSQQWAQSSSSSTWWNWQGSWWTPYPCENYGGRCTEC